MPPPATRLVVFLPALPFFLAGCLAFPLPDQGPDRPDEWPTPGMSAEQVRAILGAPDLLDTPTHRVYEWANDRSFVVAAAPLGVPVGGVFGGRRFRALVRFDSLGLAESVEVEHLPERIEHRGAELEACYRLASVPGLDEVDFVLETGGTRTFSPDGDLLAASDRHKRVWVLDVRARRAELVHAGARGWMLSFFPPGPVRTSFSPSAQELALAQYRGESALLERDALGRFGSSTAVGDEDLLAVAFATGGEPLFLDGDDRVRPALRPGSPNPSVAQAQLVLGRRGPAAGRVAAAAELLAARVDSSGFQPDQVVVFDADGNGLAVLDPRRAATGWGPPGLCVSPCGRWLARNSGRHLELWNCADLVATLSGTTTDAPAPAAVFVLPPAHLDEDWLEPAAAVAFDRGSRWVAAATATSIHVWRLADGQRVAALGPLPIELDRHDELPVEAPVSALRVDRLALAPDGRLTALLHDFRETLFVVSWRLDDAGGAP